MEPLWTGILLSGAAAAAALAVYWTVGLWRVVQTMMLLPTAKDGLGLAPPDASVSVVIPAHNEAEVIGNLIHSLRQQDHPRVRFVLALDRCTDATVSVARAAIGPDPRFEAFEITHCPEEWAGKVNAVWTALHRSEHARSADLLLFADADTIFHPGCVRATAALMESRGLALLSLMSTLTTDTWYERLIQPAAALELMRQYPPLRASRAAGRRRAFANGQFMLFRASDYWAFGGHEAVKDHLLEDLGLARVVAAEGLPAALLNAHGVLVCRMYHSWAEFRKGWKRIYTECANRKPARLARAARRLLVTGVLLPGLSAAGLLAACLAPVDPGPLPTVGRWLCAYALLAWLLALAAVYRMGRSPVWAVPLHPVGAWRVSRILREASEDLVHDRPTEWGGRAYSRASR
ncbi:MAG TPA: glycosyltransferase [Phycisphaerales bacterium]|nr:glycosyltransferase [Phycisphaerales bacterium]